jgi:5-methylcytosine-specific restriction enzyme A
MRLKLLKNRVATMQPRIQAPAHQHGSPGKRLTGRPLQRIRMQVLRDEPLCRHCSARGLVAVAVEVDHITPLHVGGTYDRSNLQGLCKPCHAIKTAGEGGSKVHARSSGTRAA